MADDSKQQGGGVALDVATIKRFIPHANEAAITRYLTKFGSLFPGWSPVIHAAWQVGDWASVRAEAHRMKSSAQSMGAEALAAACIEIDEALKAGDTGVAAQALKRMPVILPELAAALQANAIPVEDRALHWPSQPLR